MEDEYELVSKDEIKKLKEENKQLKKQLEEKNNVTKTDDKENEVVTQIIKSLHEESRKERELVLKNLDEIKNINKSTLSNLLEKTEHLDGRFEQVVVNLKELVVLLSNDLKEIENYKKDMNENGQSSNISNLSSDKTLEKLYEIEAFMVNLKTLLSYVKPNDLIVEEPKEN